MADLFADPAVRLAAIVFLALLAALLLLALALQVSARRRHQRQRLDRLRVRQGAPVTAESLASIRRTDLEPGTKAGLTRLVPDTKAVRRRLDKAGWRLSVANYALINAATITGATALLMLAGLSGMLALIAGIGLGLLVPHALVGMAGERRVRAFGAGFPDGLDLMVRGLKAGLPVGETIATVGRELPDPMGTEFRTIADQVRLGSSLEEALWAATERFDIPEFRFFALSVALQRETGGNLGETLANLADILRQRAQLRLKIRALTSEGRTSAIVLAALPFMVFFALFFLNREYALVLLNDPRGLLITAGGLGSMMLGAMIMVRMVNFKV